MLPYLDTGFRRIGRVGILALRGYLTRSTWEEAQFLFKHANERKIEGLGLDCSELRDIDSKGLLWLYRMGTLLHERGYSLYAYGLSEPLQMMMELVDLDGAVSLLPTENDFLALAGGEPRLTAA